MHFAGELSGDHDKVILNKWSLNKLLHTRANKRTGCAAQHKMYKYTSIS